MSKQSNYQSVLLLVYQSIHLHWVNAKFNGLTVIVSLFYINPHSFYKQKKTQQYKGVKVTIIVSLFCISPYNCGSLKLSGLGIIQSNVIALEMQNPLAEKFYVAAVWAVYHFH